ncbi:MAG: DUF222 domain-containing protein, partial [Actinomycetes bacterium]
EQGAALAAAVNAVITRTRRQANAKIHDPDADVPDADVPDAGVPDAGVLVLDVVDLAVPGGAGSGDGGASDPGAAAGQFEIVDVAPSLTPITDWPLDPGQARADALVDLARLAAAAGDLPECGGLAPTVIVTVPLARLEADCTTPATGATPTRANHGLGGDRGHSDSGHGSGDQADLFENRSAFVAVSNGPGQFLVSARTAARLACDCTIHRLVLDPAGLPLDVGRSTRAIPKQIRIALNQRDQGCCYPGCERPPGWCEAHHVKEWARGGSTTLDNLILACARHHHVIHESEHTITIEPGQRPVITKPRWPAAA